MSTTPDELTEVLALLPEDRPEALVSQATGLVATLIQQRADVRLLVSECNRKAQAKWEIRKEALLRQRQAIYSDFTSDKLSDLRHISRELRRASSNNDGKQPFHSDEDCLSFCSIANSVEADLERLQAIVGKDKELPLSLRHWVFDPITAMVTFDGSHGSWEERCTTCDMDITNSEKRWRCFRCAEDNVHCVDCQKVFNRHQDCDMPNLLEKGNPYFRRLEIASPSGSLASTLVNIFRVWPDRPCFRETKNNGAKVWLTYRQVYERVSRIAALFHKTGAREILICFPAGSVEFYLADLACALAGITSIGCPASPPPKHFINVHHVICEKRLEAKLKLPDSVELLDMNDAQDMDPFHVRMDVRDPENSLYTEYFTSGSTGVPKRIPCTRKEFIDKMNASRACIPGCYLSFLPAYWATDRGGVYTSLYNGYRIGFSHREPSLVQIVQDFQEIQPSFASLPPVFVQFLMTLNPPPSLGNQLRFGNCGGAPVGAAATPFVREAYGIPCGESYGTTECGGIMFNGRVRPEVADHLRLRDPQTNEWLDLKQKGSIVGELWVRDVNTEDIVEISGQGKRLRVLGRSGTAASFKMENGKWCSLVDIEDEIMRACAPEHLKQAFVMLNSKGDLILVAVVPDKPDPKWLLQQIRSRVTMPFECFPKGLVISQEAIPTTQNHKIRRGAAVDKFRAAAEAAPRLSAGSQGDQDDDDDGALDVTRLAAKVLGQDIDPGRSFLENGGDSISAVPWLKALNLTKKPNTSDLDWISLLNKPLNALRSPDAEPVDLPTSMTPEKVKTSSSEDCQGQSARVPPYSLALNTLSVEPAPEVDETAHHILLTGATGFLGRHVLDELLRADDDTIIVCLVRPESRHKLPSSERVRVVTEVPTIKMRYRQVIHLAARVDHIQSYETLYADNVQLTHDLMHLRLAPMLYCSTSSTRVGPHVGGYTQSKFVSEQIVLKSGGQCVWPPFLVWGNRKDWLTRLIQHCVDTRTYPTSLGFLPSARVETCAREIVEASSLAVTNRTGDTETSPTVSQQDLDLSELFTRICMRIPGMQPVALGIFRANAARDPRCALYPILPLIPGDRIGLARSPELDLMTLESADIQKLLDSLDFEVDV